MEQKRSHLIHYSDCMDDKSEGGINRKMTRKCTNYYNDKRYQHLREALDGIKACILCWCIGLSTIAGCVSHGFELFVNILCHASVN